MPRRRTKILATLGPATDPPGVLEAMVATGVDGVRISCSHGSPDEWERRVDRARVIAAEAGRQVAVVFDLQGPKIRLAADTGTPLIEAGEEVVMVPGDETPPGTIAVNWAGFAGAVTPGKSQLIVGDGAPRFDLTAVTGRGTSRRVQARCTVPGRLGPSRGVVVSHSRARRRSPITAKDRADLRIAAACHADFIALSYVCDPKDITALRDHLAELELQARVIAKIETVEACEALDAIVGVADAVMVARGDLGVQVGVAQVPALQRTIVRSCRQAGKLAIMATQMLESMVEGGSPTRAEATDIATAVVQGSSTLMLSAETAVGRDPAAAVRAMDEITRAADAVEVQALPDVESEIDDEESIMRAAALLGLSVGAAAYIVPTSGGRSVRALARHRPSAPIVALAHSTLTARQLSLEWGVLPTTLTPGASTDETIERAIARARELAELPEGAKVVVTSGTTVGAPGSTSVIALRRLRRLGVTPRRNARRP